VKHTIHLPLLLDVRGYRILATMFADGTGEVSIRPEFSSPKFFLHLWASFEDFSCGEALDRRYHLGYCVCRDGLDEEAHVVLVCTNLQEFQLVSVLNLYAHILHDHVYIFIEHGTSVLCRKNKMVYQYRNIMALMDVFAHITTLRRKRRGIQP